MTIPGQDSKIHICSLSSLEVHLSTQSSVKHFLPFPSPLWRQKWDYPTTYRKNLCCKLISTEKYSSSVDTLQKQRLIFLQVVVAETETVKWISGDVKKQSHFKWIW